MLKPITPKEACARVCRRHPVYPEVMHFMHHDGKYLYCCHAPDCEEWRKTVVNGAEMGQCQWNGYGDHDG